MAEPLSSEQLDDPVVLHMNPTEVTVRPEQSVAQALESVRKARPSKRIVYIYVVDDEGVLRGVVPTRALLITPVCGWREASNNSALQAGPASGAAAW